MSVSKELIWRDVQSTDTLTVFEAIEGELIEILADTTLKGSEYFVTTVSGLKMHRVEDIRKELLPTGEKNPESVTVEFLDASYKPSKSIRSIILTVSGYISMSVRVAIKGESTNEFYGFIETTKNRLTAEIEVRNRSAWTMSQYNSSPTPMSVCASEAHTPPPSPIRHDTPVSPIPASDHTEKTRQVSAKDPDASPGKTSWLKNPDSPSRHPLIVGVITVFLTVVVGAIIGLTLHIGPFKPDSGSPAPAVPATSSIDVPTSVMPTAPTQSAPS